MLSKLFSSARNLFHPVSQTNNDLKLALNKNPSNLEKMVTTRGQSSQAASQEGTSIEDAIEVDVPRSSRKRSRNTRLEDEVGGAVEAARKTPTKKQKVLPVREKDDDVVGMNKSTKVVVEIPVSNTVAEVHDLTGDTKGEDPEEEDEAEEDGLSDSDGEGSEAEPVTENSAPVPEATGNGEESPVVDWEGSEVSDSESDGSDAPRKVTKPIPAPAKKPNPSATPPKKSGTTPMSVQPKHKRFGSEEPGPEPEFFSTAIEIQDSDEESSDDDAAPEVVGAQEALKSAQSKAREAAKAVEE
jgi:hypothetical protein